MRNQPEVNNQETKMSLHERFERRFNDDIRVEYSVVAGVTVCTAAILTCVISTVLFFVWQLLLVFAPTLADPSYGSIFVGTAQIMGVFTGMLLFVFVAVFIEEWRKR